jgi:HTH-type transcriptional regulator, transcriptional repressor of NAD biosynthesis genes
MKRGLVIGKFLPIHKGHISLIRFAAQHCDELVVSMSYTDADPIRFQLRFGWLKEIFRAEPAVQVHLLKDDFDIGHLHWSDRTRIWARVLEEKYGEIDLVASSEEYGSYLANHLKAENLLFDPDRKQIPVSASQIRKLPLQFWEFIPHEVQPYFVKKICFYGPESTGKSTLAKRMAELYQTEFVPEVARELITSNDFTVDDIIKIGNAQTQRVLEKVKIANRFLFCDTDLITTQIYSRHYLGVIPEVLYELEKKITYDFYFLFYPDIAWVSDGLRDLKNQREKMFDVFRVELEKRNISYVLVKGNYTEREQIVTDVLNRLLSPLG